MGGQQHHRTSGPFTCLSLHVYREYGLGTQWQGPPNGTESAADIPLHLLQSVIVGLIGASLDEAALRIGMTSSQLLQTAR